MATTNDNNNLFTLEDLDTLFGDKDQHLPIVIKDNFLVTIGECIQDEIGLLSRANGVLKTAEMSRGENTWQAGNSRGDQMCWVSDSVID